MKKSKLFLLIGLVYCAMFYAQTVNIPDANFKAYLVGNTSINTNGDNEIQISEATAFTGEIQCANKNIADLTGVEAFTKIFALSFSSNQVTSLDVSKNLNLVGLNCSQNMLTSLDISKNTALQYLYCGNNLLTDLDVSKNTNLRTLNCVSNQITNLDMSKNIALLNLVCNYNQLTHLDISKNIVLSSFYCSNNQLTSLNLKNGNNSNLGIGAFTSINNPNLTCIQVDNVANANSYTTSGNWTKDATASYNTDCSVTMFATDIKEKTLQIYPNPAKDFIILKSEKKENFVYQIFDLSGRMIKAGKGNFNERIEVKDLGRGNYVLQVESESGEKFNEKFIKD